jgi:hypothetical protein
MANFGDTFKQIVGTLAPTVATALGGPFAGAAVGALEKVFGVTGGDPQAIEKAVLNASPDDLAKVKIAEIDFQKTLSQLGVERDALAYADTSNARAREVAVKDWIPGLLAMLLVGGFFAVLAYLIAIGKPKEGGDALLVLLGSLGSGFTAVIAYYYGSSAGSAAKTDALQKLAAK